MQPLDPDVGCAGACDGLAVTGGDREIVIDALRAACAHGRLSKSELDRRAVLVLESSTRTGLADATAGIPPVTADLAVAAAVARPERAAPARRRMSRQRVIAWVVGLAILLPALSVAFLDTKYGSFFIMLCIGSAATAVMGSASPADHRRRHRRR
jgi:Domain of unknown function (DUF1707)